MPAGRKKKGDRHPAEILRYYRDLIDDQMTEVGQKLTKVEGWDKFSLNQRLYLYARVDTATHVAAARDLGLGERWLRENRKGNSNFSAAVEVAKGLGIAHTIQYPPEVLRRDADDFLMRVMKGGQKGAKMSDRIAAARVLKGTPLDKVVKGDGTVSSNGRDMGVGALEFEFGPDR